MCFWDLAGICQRRSAQNKMATNIKNSIWIKTPLLFFSLCLMLRVSPFRSCLSSFGLSLSLCCFAHPSGLTFLLAIAFRAVHWPSPQITANCQGGARVLLGTKGVDVLRMWLRLAKDQQRIPLVNEIWSHSLTGIIDV